MKINKSVNYLLIGYGYWGPNLARNIAKNKNSNLSTIIDNNKENLKSAKKKKIANTYLNDSKKLDNDMMQDIDIIVIATPPDTHSLLIKDLAHFKKDFLVTKPVITNSIEIEEIKNLMMKYNFEIFVDETYVYSNKVKKIKEIVNNNAFGEMQYIYSIRSNLGLIQKSQNVVWDLAPHDLSIASFVTGLYPVNAIAFSSNPLKNIKANDTIASLKFEYPTGIDFYLNLSWLTPEKHRYMIFSGTNQTLIYDDNLEKKSLVIYDQKISLKNNNFIYEKNSGKSIQVNINEPLQDEINQLSEYKLKGQNKPFTTFENSIKNIISIENISYL